MDYIGTILQKESLDSTKYEIIALWCNETQCASIEDKGSYFEVVEISQPSAAEKHKQEIEYELYTLKSWLSEHDYIGTKIATGRATVDEYKTEIAEMSAKADRINEIEAELASLQ